MTMRLIRGKATTGVLLAPLAWAMAALAVGFAPHVPYFPPWITAMTFASGGWRLLAEHRRWHLPPLWLRALLALAALLGVLSLYSSINGIVPGTALLALMAALKLLETHRRRDLYVVLFIALFLMLASVLREQALWSLPYLFVALLAVLVAWQQVARLGQVLPASRALRSAMRLGAHALPLLLAFWILFPRVPGPFWAVPTQSGVGATGISDRIEPGSIASLIRSDAVAFRVEFDDALPATRDLYWRGPVMETIVGRAWQASDYSGTGRIDDEVSFVGESYRYRMTLQPTGQFWLFALDIPEAWDHPKARMTPTQQLTVRRPIDQRTVLELRSYTEFSIGTALGPQTRRRLLKLPSGSNPRAQSLGAELRESSASVDEFIGEVLELFASDFVYTLEPPLLGQHSMDEFLFETKAGFCEHFATAFATLMRAGGVPSRVVAGYQGGEVNPLGDYLIVRQSDAHAWVEIWRDDYGWTRIDPTAAVSAIRLESGLDAALRSSGQRGLGGWLDFAWLSGAGFTWDAINARWDEWVLGYGPETQQRFMRWLGMDDPRWDKLAFALGIAALGCLGLVAFQLARRYARPRPDDAERIYRRALRRLRVALAPHETASVAAHRFADRYPALAGAGQSFFDRYQAVRYGGADDVPTLEREARDLIGAARRARATATKPR
ncbi:MAG: DUF3488 and transglutaminase-like domain-containing protein [Pseudomonadota bacterium]